MIANTTKRLNLAVPYNIFMDWIQSNNIQEGRITERLNILIKMDTNLSEDKKQMRDIEKSILENEKVITNLMAETTALKVKKNLLLQKQEGIDKDLKEKKEVDTYREIDLLKELMIQDDIKQNIF